MGVMLSHAAGFSQKDAISMSTKYADKQSSVTDRVEHVLGLIRPAIQSDGGDIELIHITDDGVVHIRFLGECVGCPSSSMTLQHGIESNLKAKVPEVASVVAVEG